MDPDPLRIVAPLDRQAVFHPLGFPLILRTNDERILSAASESWSHFPPTFQIEPIEMEVIVEPPAEPVFAARRHLIAIASGPNLAVCDHTRRFAFCRLDPVTAADTAHVRYYYLEAMALFTLTQLYVTPIHGACVAKNGRALLLCGDSGAGKSTLAYAAARQGWTYISDNETWLKRDDGRTILGNPKQIRLRDTAATLFPELAAQPTIIFNGKRTIVLASHGLETAFQAVPHKIVFLNRTPDTATLRPIPRSAASTRLLEGIIQYTPEVRRQHRESIERFTEIPALELTFRHLDDALPALEGLLE